MQTRTRTPQEIEAARARLRAHDARLAAFEAQRHDAPAVDALTLCNACGVNTMHDGCAAGHCARCCTAH